MRRILTILLLGFGLLPFHANAQRGVDELEDPLEGSFRSTQTTVEDQKDVAVTIYNNNLALVKDTRHIALFPGEVSLKFMDVAQQIMPETVSIKSISEPGALQILEQNYEYDLMSPDKLMEKYVGKDVRLVSFSKDLGFTEVGAELLSVNNGPVYRVKDEIYLGHPGTVVLPEVPDNLIAKPTLIWLLDTRESDQDVEVTYLTRGVSWRADYVLKLNEEESHADIDAWVTLDNQSGTAYEHARLKLVAGDVNIVTPQQRRDYPRAVMAEAAMAPAMREETFAEYHLYTLPRRTTIKQNQSKQVSLFTTTGVEMKKRYEFRGEARFFSQQVQGLGHQNVAAIVEFQNSEENELGVPLPAGIIRIYQEDQEGMLQFAGEDSIRHTPKDERVQLHMGDAFDIVGERVQTNFNAIARNVRESSYEITLRNHKEEDVTVDVVEPMPGDWTITSASHEHEKRDARTAVFTLPVEADGETVLTYTVRVTL